MEMINPVHGSSAPGAGTVKGQRVSSSLDLDVVHRVTKRRREVAQRLLAESSPDLVVDFEDKFESLLDNPRDHVKRRFPTFHWSLAIVTSWRYRLLATAGVMWKVTADVIAMTAPGQECVSTSELSATTMMSLIVAYSGSCLLTIIQCLLLNLGTRVYSGSLFTSVHDDMKYDSRPCDIFLPDTFGYYRLLESQLRLAEENEGAPPRESWWTTFFLWHLPRGYVLIWCTISFLDLLDMYAGTHTQGIGPCASREQTLRYSWTQLWFIPGIICWTLPCIGVITLLYGLFIGTSLVSYELLRWVDRYRCLKDARDDEEGASGEFIRKDAYERYFLLHRIVEASSKLWNGFLCVCLSLTLIGGILFLSYIFYSGAWLGGYSALAYFYLLLFLSFFSLPIYLLATANLPNSRFIQLFTWSVPPPPPAAAYDHEKEDDGDRISPAHPWPSHRQRLDKSPVAGGRGDFGLIGGRSEWLRFLNSAPIYWVVAGVPVTAEKLSGVIFSALLSVVLSTLPKIFASARPPTV